MVELLEYVIVFALSAGVAGASVALVGGALPGLSHVASASSSDQIASTARIAVLEGRSVTLLLPLEDASVSCESGSLAVSMGNYTRSYDLAYPCSFDFRGLQGTCSLTFSAPADSIELEARC